MLDVENTQTKVTLYKDAVSDAGNGFGAMSMTRAKREILGMSDDDIKQDLLEQRMEKAAAAELANSASVIKHTGVFDIVDVGTRSVTLTQSYGGTVSNYSITNQVTLKITDFTSPEDKESAILLWDQQVNNLKRILGA
jgi:hypothetical protein